MGDFSGREIKILLGTASRTDDILVARKQELFPLAGGGGGGAVSSLCNVYD